MAPLEVIGAGWGRTGTDSLRIALNTLGYNTHHMKSFFMDSTTNTDDFLNAFHHRDEADWDKIYENYSAAVDWPTCTFYQDLMIKYPEAKIILTERSAESWYESAKNTIYQAAVSVANDPEHDKFRTMVTDVCANGILVDPIKFQDKETIKAKFIQHNKEVKRLVPKDRLLVLELGEGWKRLCEFLGKEVPDIPYPKANSTKDFNARPRLAE